MFDDPFSVYRASLLHDTTPPSTATKEKKNTGENLKKKERKQKKGLISVRHTPLSPSSPPPHLLCHDLTVRTTCLCNPRFLLSTLLSYLSSPPLSHNWSPPPPPPIVYPLPLRKGTHDDKDAHPIIFFLSHQHDAAR